MPITPDEALKLWLSKHQPVVQRAQADIDAFLVKNPTGGTFDLYMQQSNDAVMKMILEPYRGWKCSYKTRYDRGNWGTPAVYVHRITISIA